jgi:probable rRNA maturation factor
VTERAIYLSPWRIDVTIRDGVDPVIRISRLARAIAAALDAAGAPAPGSIGLILADDVELAELNRTHLGGDGPTDVLSFPLLPPGAFSASAAASPSSPGGEAADAAAEPAFATPPGRRLHLGDIVVSVERAAEQAAAGLGGQTGDVRWSTADELRLLVTHGTLHVCGWDHAEPADEAAMRDLERRLLAG